MYNKIKQEDALWAASVSEKIYEKVKVTAKRNQGKIPFTTVEGRWDDWSDRIWWWTDGFYAGQLWQLYHAFGEEFFCEEAVSIEEKLDQCLMDYQAMDHDSGFRWLLTSVAHYKKNKNDKSRNRALLAAANMAGRFNAKGNFIRAWNDPGDGHTAGWAIIDCMMNLPLLYWAYEQTNDPRFSHIAKAHADMAKECFVREDGSVHHIVCFDTITGEKTGTLGGQGIKEGSSWTRGQAWAIYGFALSYLHSQDETYLVVAKNVAKYFINSMPDSGFVPVDFYQPAECDWEDSTAAAIAACGMLQITSCVEDEEEKLFFHEAAMKLLKKLEAERCDWTLEKDNIIEKCTSAYHDENHNFAIIYGDYFFTEAILKLCDKEWFLW